MFLTKPCDYCFLIKIFVVFLNFVIVSITAVKKQIKIMRVF